MKQRYPTLTHLTLVIFTILIVSVSATGQESSQLPPAAEGRVDFLRDVQPVLTRCYACHGPSQQMNGLRLDTREGALKGGYSGPVIVPAKSAESKLVLRVASSRDGFRMPPAGPPLTAKDIGILRAWIDQGAEWAESSTAPKESRASAGQKKSEHWAFRPIRRAQLPAVKQNSWARNPIDAFILAKLESEGVAPSPEADKITLIRRLSFDLIGLPPTPQEVEQFSTDDSPEAYERLVNRLLDSPHYGEKWARHWLDLARYADSDGYEKDQARPYAWRWRHWVIEALNRDMPFDQFTRQQIAGDLLPRSSPELVVATGFHHNGLKNREAGVKREEARFEEMVDRTNTVSTVWLGLTVGCAVS